jgi:hypothetical protein
MPRLQSRGCAPKAFGSCASAERLTAARAPPRLNSFG